MKILVFIAHYPPYVGGVESYAEEMHNELLSQLPDTQITIFTSDIGMGDDPKSPQNIKILHFPATQFFSTLPIPKFWSIKFWRQIRYLYTNDYDCIFSHTRFFITSLAALLYSKTKSVRWIHIEHGSDHPILRSKLSTFIARVYDIAVCKAIFRSASVNVSVSKKVQEFVNLFDNRLSPVIHRGIRDAQFSQAPPNHRLKTKFKNFTVVCFVGRLMAGKGVADLLRAIHALNNRRVACVIVGNGPERFNLERLSARLGLKNNVYFTGQLDYSDAISIMKIADIIVNPSYTEGLPTVVLEGAMCKTAIIATNVGGTEEVIINHKTGLLFEPRDINAQARCLHALIANQNLRSKLANSAYQYVKSNYKWSGNIQRLISLLR